MCLNAISKLSGNTSTVGMTLAETRTTLHFFVTMLQRKAYLTPWHLVSWQAVQASRGMYV